MPTAIIWFNLFLLFVSPAIGNSAYHVPEVLIIDEEGVPVSLNPHLQAYRLESFHDPQEVLQKLYSDQLEEAESHTSPGFSKDYYWLHFTLENESSDRLYLELDNPHIDFVELYRIDTLRRATLVDKTGDKTVFDTRDVKNRRFVFDLGQEKQTSYLMMIDKRYASVSFPLKVWTHDAFSQNEDKANVLFGFYFGVVLFVGLFSLFSGISLRDGVFFSYGIYVVLFSLYIFTQLGFSFQYLYPNSAVLNNYSRVGLAIIMVICALDFFRKFLNADIYTPRLNVAYKWINASLAVLLLIWLIDKQFNPDYAKTTTSLLRMLYFIVFAIMFSTVYLCIITWKKQRGTSLLFLLAFSAVLLGSAVYILIEFGVVPESKFVVNPILLGSIGEILILSGSMVYRVKSINDKKNELTQKSAQQQKELMKAYVRGGEKERSRISAELHDNIGSNLSLLKARINRQNGGSNELNAEIDRLCEDVRNLSHQLLPHSLEITGLQNTVKEYCEKFRKDTGISVDLEFYTFPKISRELSLQIYRVLQEALQNVWKHSQASLVEIQMIGYDHELVVTVDDNGEGFDPEQYQLGNGLQSMKSRIEAVEGTMELVSYSGRGTNLMFKVPIFLTE